MLGGAAAAADSELLRLAAAARMNTDVRRAVFCCVMGAEDATDAFERLLRLGLKVRVPILPASGISNPALLRLGSKGTRAAPPLRTLTLPETFSVVKEDTPSLPSACCAWAQGDSWGVNHLNAARIVTRLAHAATGKA